MFDRRKWNAFLCSLIANTCNHLRISSTVGVPNLIFFFCHLSSKQKERNHSRCTKFLSFWSITPSEFFSILWKWKYTYVDVTWKMFSQRTLLISLRWSVWFFFMRRQIKISAVRFGDDDVDTKRGKYICRCRDQGWCFRRQHHPHDFMFVSFV